MAAPGQQLDDVVQVCRWLEEAGVDYFHVSAGTRLPASAQPGGPASRRGTMVQDLRHAALQRAARAVRNYVVFQTWPLSAVFRWWWERPSRRLGIEGINLPGSRGGQAEAVAIPVLCTGGFQTASVIAGAIERGDCDGVTIARPLVANPDLVRLLRAGARRAAAAVHVLQQVPVQLHRESARLLRGGAVRLAGGDGPRRSSRSTSRPAPRRRPRRRRSHDRTDVATIFEPLRFRTLEVKNRVFRSSLAGRFNNYDGTGNQAHVNWDLKFARGGVGAIISSNAPVHPRGLIVPNYAHIDRDETVPFWREVVRRVHEHDCRYIVQLAFSGRQRDMGGIQFEKGWSSTDKPEPIHGLRCERMTVDEIRELVDCFAQAARRAREAGADGIEVHGCNGYLITQFLSPAINDRKDDYGGSLENRARFALEVVRAIRGEVGDGLPPAVQDHAPSTTGRISFPGPRGARRSRSRCRCASGSRRRAWTASTSPPATRSRTRATRAGGFPIHDVVRGYDTMISSGRHTFRNYLLFEVLAVQPRVQVGLGADREGSRGGDQPRRLPRRSRRPSRFLWCARAASRPHPWSRRRSSRGDCDGVTIARPLIANPDLVELWRAGHDRPPRPCTYSNKCLINQLENPLGCYDESRFGVARGDGRGDPFRLRASAFADQ